MEKNKLFFILNDWNYWDKPVPEFFPRDEYQQKINHYLSADEVIVLKGIRRSGKSTLLINHIRHLISSGVDKKEILFVNFEDPRLSGVLNSEFLEQIFEVYKEFINHETRPHIFLDEVQHVTQWEKWVLTGYELNRAQFYVTGSSSKLLSREFGTTLSGRFLAINMFPLGFKEYLMFNNIPVPDKTTVITEKLLYKKTFNNYFRSGGFPRVCALDDELGRLEIITYYETIILKDIVARHNLKNYESVKKVSLYLLSNIGKPFNLNKIRTSLHLSYDLVDKYFEYLKETFLLFEINQYDYLLNKQFANPRKAYCIDNGLLTHTSFRISEDFGRFLENLVFVELMRRGHEVYFFQGKKECDFIISGGKGISQSVQVSRTLEDEMTRKRETEGLIESLNAFGLNEGYILTEDDEFEMNIEGISIKVMPVWKWLLEQNELFLQF